VVVQKAETLVGGTCKVEVIKRHVDLASRINFLKLCLEYGLENLKKKKKKKKKKEEEERRLNKI
jgi:hypothetical protein